MIPHPVPVPVLKMPHFVNPLPVENIYPARTRQNNSVIYRYVAFLEALAA